MAIFKVLLVMKTGKLDNSHYRDLITDSNNHFCLSFSLPEGGDNDFTETPPGVEGYTPTSNTLSLPRECRDWFIENVILSIYQ